MKQTRTNNRESEEMLDFRDWIAAQEGEEYNECTLKGFGWKYMDDEVRYPGGVKTHYTTYRMKDGGAEYRLEVAWNSFSETIVDSNIWIAEPEK